VQVPIHLALSWLVAAPLPQRRDRVLVTWAGVAPDLDALSLLGGAEAFGHYHHVLTHGVVAAVAVAVAASLAARQRWRVLLLALVTFHLHLACDLIGSGVAHQPWSITYFWPFSRSEYWVNFGWDLASVQNGAIWVLAVVLTGWIGVRWRRTFCEAFLPQRTDAAIVAVLRKRFSRRQAAAGPGSTR